MIKMDMAFVDVQIGSINSIVFLKKKRNSLSNFSYEFSMVNNKLVVKDLQSKKIKFYRLHKTVPVVGGKTDALYDEYIRSKKNVL